MRVLEVRNVHEALPAAISLIRKIGVKRDSRNGPVLYGGPVSTVYNNPLEKVVFWSGRDANPFFHLYESLWMLAGRDDVTPLERYVKNSINYSDDGKTLHGAYGYRWIHSFGFNQLAVIAETLQENPDDRRCVLQMWDAQEDLGQDYKDLPCNTIATFQRGVRGELNLTVFCRSNDIIWGAYGANAVQFGTLLEYMALWIGCPVGTYTQVSVNWHAYLDTLEKVSQLNKRESDCEYPYEERRVVHVPMTGSIDEVDADIRRILKCADDGFREDEELPRSQWAREFYIVLAAHYAYKDDRGVPSALGVLSLGNTRCDWNVAAREWLERRANRKQN